MRLINTLLFSILICNSLASQKDSSHIAKNLIYLKAGGTCGYGSLNYERNIYTNKKLNAFSRIGISTYHTNDFTNKFNPDLLIPILLNICYGKNHKIELGTGETFATIVKADSKNFKPTRFTNFHTNFTLAYRFQKEKGGFVFRCAYTPNIEFNKYLRHWAGISFGYSF